MSNAALMEREFETAICTSLQTHGWLYTPGDGDTGFDHELALHPEDVLHWLATQYPDEYTKAIPESLSETATQAAEHKLLVRITKELGKTPIINKLNGSISGGLLGVLRGGFDHAQMGRQSAKFGPHAAFMPSNPAVTTQVEKAQANRLRVIQQVKFDTTTTETIDLVLLVNGIPVATMEIKTDNTQTVHDAMTQYRRDRAAKPSRPLLAPGRCLVHFAVSNSEVYMTTKLAGADTRFLPFNQGNDSHAGNPPSDTGSATDYLWHKVLTPDLFLRILRDYALWEPSESKAGQGTLIFPRFHQLRAVERVLEDVAEIGSGGRYLVQHSAGSGKTKTIAWLAQRLVRFFDAGGHKTFDSVIIVSDRQVLDRNIADGLDLLQASEGSIVTVDASMGSKSRMLREALSKGGRIISCTIQTFPALAKAMDHLAEEEAQAGGTGRVNTQARSYAVIMDEAHSSQHGDSALALRRMLTAAHLDETEDITSDELMQAVDSAVATAGNVSFVALTATPKPKTVAAYGIEDPETPGTRTPFDTYMMAQAIEEGFILDVLRNYTTYQMFAQVRDELGRDQEVVKGEAVSDLVRFVRLHPTSIAQKVEVVVEHFRRNVMPLLGGQAKAMVVTDSRRAALHWSQAMNTYIATKGYDKQMNTLVAFSGSQSLTEGMDDARVTEASLNKVSDTEAAFKNDDVNKVLIVANKFQTGFDEPRLCAMYVDKKLSGIMAVQTLSRLNRIYPGKPDPVVIDFANDPSVIVDSFRDYYTEAFIDTDIDPNALHDLAQKIDSDQFYTWQQVEDIAAAYTQDPDGENIQHLVYPIRNKWHGALTQAVIRGDEDTREQVLAFRKNISSYKKAWEFLSQIVDYQDVTLHKRAILCAILERNLHLDAKPEKEDHLQGVALVGAGVAPESVEENLNLPSSKDPAALKVPGFEGTAAGTGTAVQIAFDEAVQEVNDIFSAAGVDLSTGTKAGMTVAVWGELAENEKVAAMAAENSEDQLRNSPSFHQMVLQALIGSAQQSQDYADLITSDQAMVEKFIGIMSKVAKAAHAQSELGGSGKIDITEG